MKNKILAYGSLIGGAVAGISGMLLTASQTAAAQLSTSTLGASIDTVNSTWYDYFTVLLNKYWPFIVGAGILVLVWHYGRKLLFQLN